MFEKLFQENTHEQLKELVKLVLFLGFKITVFQGPLLQNKCLKGKQHWKVTVN